MLKKILVLLGFAIVLNIPLQAQHTNIDLNYQNFRPFIHFQLDFKSYGYNYDAYERTYLKGYMDGVNNQHYFGYNFADLGRNINAYRTGYKDGFRDRKLLIRLRGFTWYQRHQFAHEDYYAPVYAVRIWLDGISLAFLQAPTHKLPYRWQYKAHPHVKKYRKMIAKRSFKVERRYKKRMHKHRKRMKKVKKQRRKAISRDRNPAKRKRYRDNRSFKSRYGIERNNDRQRSRSVTTNKSRSRKAVKKDNRRERTREADRKRVRDADKSKRKSRSKSRDRDG